MFSNFNNTFKNKNQYDVNIPQAVLDAISVDLPTGLEYKHIGDGLCVINPDGGFTIGGCKLSMSENAKKLIQNGKPFNIFEYSYNTQTPIQFIPDENGCFTINDKTINANEFLKAPMKNVSFNKSSFLLTPQPFPAPRSLSIGYASDILDLQIQQQTIESVTKCKYSTINDSPIELSFIINNETLSTQFNIKICLEKAKSIIEIVSAINIFNAFIEGKGMIGGYPFPLLNNNENEGISQDTVTFWNKVLQLEDFLNVSFKPTIDVTVDLANTIEELHHTLILKKPFKKQQNYNDVTGNGRFESGIDEFLGKELYFEYVRYIEVDIFNVSVSLYTFIGIFNAVAKEYRFQPNNEEGEFELKLIPSEGKKMYASEIYFIDEKLLDEFREQKNHIELLKEADEIRYYY